jgi:ABC-type transport system involved in multi-copper enzyme maturation permease subunit
VRFLAIIQLTIRESLAKKTFIAFWAISTFICLLFIFALNLDIVNGAESSIKLFGLEGPQLVELNKIIIGVEAGVAFLLFTGGIFMSLFATSNLIPTLLQPGFIDLFISKPVSRLEIIAGRFTGALVIVALNIFYLIIFTFLIMSLKTGIWNWSFLAAGLMILITFSALFALMTLLGVISGSGPFSLMLTYLILFFSPLLLQRDHIYALLNARIYGYILDGLYYLLPKTAELGMFTEELIRGNGIQAWMPVWSSILFGFLSLGLSAYIFQKKDF